MAKIRHLEPYGFNEQPQFDGLVNTVKANIENIKKKNEEQDEKDEAQDANITQVTSTLTDSLNQKLGSGFTGDNSANTVTSVIENNKKITASALNDLNDRKADLSALTAHISDNEKHITAEERTKWNGKILSASYDSSNHKINFYSGATSETPVSIIDATDFIKDGMVKQVEIKNAGNSDSSLVITFNADAGNEVITIPVSEIFNPANYYLKTDTSGATELNTAFGLKANQSDLTAHTGNGTIHVTSDDKTNWNNAADKSHTHGNKDVLDTIRTIDFELNENSKNLVVNSAITKVIVDNEKIVSASLNDLNDRKLDASAYTPTDLSDYYKKEETSGKTDLDAAFNKKANSTDLDTHISDNIKHITSDERTNWDNTTTTLATHTGDSTIHITSDERTNWNGKISSAQYSKTDKKIYFYSGATTENPVTNIDATDFIKDGMVSNVEIKDVTDSGSCLVITFNADAGNQVITIPASKIFDSGKYYLKTETSGSTELNTAFGLKADTGHRHLSSDISDIVTEITASNSGSTSVPTVNAVMQLINAKLDINYTGFTGTTLTGVTTIIQAIQKIADKLDELPNS